jgi:hypothetical protein
LLCTLLCYPLRFIRRSLPAPAGHRRFPQESLAPKSPASWDETSVQSSEERRQIFGTSWNILAQPHRLLAVI